MTDRERLIELITEKQVWGIDQHQTEKYDIALLENEELADHLLANGVTVQEWISVKDRLPKLIPCNAGTAYSEAVIVWTDNRKAMIAVWDGTDFMCAARYWEAEGEEITHWMPLPKPPKGA